MTASGPGRDQSLAARRGVLSGERGPRRCHYTGECSRVCPKGADPAKAIQLMKRELVPDYIGLATRRCPAKEVGAAREAKRRDNPPEPLKRTVYDEWPVARAPGEVTEKGRPPGLPFSWCCPVPGFRAGHAGVGCQRSLRLGLLAGGRLVTIVRTLGEVAETV